MCKLTYIGYSYEIQVDLFHLDIGPRLWETWLLFLTSQD